MNIRSIEFDDILEDRIKVSHYHYRLYALAGLLFVVEGADVIALSLALPILEREWGLNSSEQAVLGTILFMGMFAGSLIVGKISDQFGRKQTMMYAALATFIFGLLSIITGSFEVFLICASHLRSSDWLGSTLSTYCGVRNHSTATARKSDGDHQFSFFGGQSLRMSDCLVHT